MEGTKDAKDGWVLKFPNLGAIRSNAKAARFVLLFLSFLGILYFLSIYFEQYIPLFGMEQTAKVLHYILGTVGIKSTLIGSNVAFSTFSMEIVRQCTGIFEVIVLASCILAFPTGLTKKVSGIVFAIPIVYFFNLGRLLLLSLIGLYSFRLFEIAHDYLLQITFVLLVVFFWMFWIERVVKDGE
jgi:archaeosortase B (VPXXXP-CTERM-specific)